MSMWTIGQNQHVEGKNIDLLSVKYGTCLGSSSLV